MPRPGPRRPTITIRIDPDQRQWVDAEAERRQVSQGHIIRELITIGMTRPPPQPRRLIDLDL